MLIHAWLFNSPSSIALYSSMKSSTSSMKEKLKDSQQQILTKTPKKGYSESITCPVSAAPHRCEKINPNLTVSHCLTRKLEFAVKHTTEWNHFQIFIHSLYSLFLKVQGLLFISVDGPVFACFLVCTFSVLWGVAGLLQGIPPHQSNKEARSPSSKQTFSWVWQGGIYCSCLFL